MNGISAGSAGGWACVAGAAVLSAVTGIVGYRCGAESAADGSDRIVISLPALSARSPAGPWSTGAGDESGGAALAGDPGSDTFTPRMTTPAYRPAIREASQPCGASLARDVISRTSGAAPSIPERAAEAVSVQTCWISPDDRAQVDAAIGEYTIALSSSDTYSTSTSILCSPIFFDGFTILGSEPNPERCLEARQLGYSAFTAGDRYESSNRTATIFGNAPGLTSVYGHVLDAFADTLARRRWEFVSSLDMTGAATGFTRPLTDQVTELTDLLANQIAPEHLAALYGGDDPRASAREWVDEGLLRNLYDRNTFMSLDAGTGTLGTYVVDGLVGPEDTK